MPFVGVEETGVRENSQTEKDLLLSKNNSKYSEKLVKASEHICLGFVPAVTLDPLALSKGHSLATARVTDNAVNPLEKCRSSAMVKRVKCSNVIRFYIVSTRPIKVKIRIVQKL